MTARSNTLDKDHHVADVSPSTARRDDGTTRYLCAAVHRHPSVAERVMIEYLVERLRAISPTPGLDLAAVLRDAVAARVRFRVRDTGLLTLVVLLAVLSPLGVLLWTAVALLITRFLADRRVPRWVVALMAPVTAIALVIVPGQLAVATGLGWSWDGPSWWACAVVGVLLLVVLGADELLVHYLIHHRFRARRFRADYRSAESSWERWLRGFGQRRFAAQLQRAAEADEYSAHAAGLADVIVHDGDSPFVGAGKVVPTQTVALTFKPLPDRAQQPVDIARLHAEVALALRNLESSSVAPGMRIEGILHREQVLIRVDELMMHSTTEFGSTVLPSRDQPPIRHLPLAAARRLASHPEGWARYYSCFRVESSTGDLVTSCYLYIGVDRYGLSLKRTHCLLPPIDRDFQWIDHMCRVGFGPVSRLGWAALLLPTTAWGRLRSTTRRLRPPRMRRKGLPVRRYGAIRSLRQRVTDPDLDKPLPEFLRTDADLYAHTVDVRLFEAIERHLEECGYDVVQFRRDVRATILQNSVYIQNGTFVSSVISAGDGAINTVSAGGPPIQDHDEEDSG